MLVGSAPEEVLFQLKVAFPPLRFCCWHSFGTLLQAPDPTQQFPSQCPSRRQSCARWVHVCTSQQEFKNPWGCVVQPHAVALVGLSLSPKTPVEPSALWLGISPLFWSSLLQKTQRLAVKSCVNSLSLTCWVLLAGSSPFQEAQRPSELSAEGALLERCIRGGAEAVLSIVGDLNEWDAKVGDADCGTTVSLSSGFRFYGLLRQILARTHAVFCLVRVLSE